MKYRCALVLLLSLGCTTWGANPIFAEADPPVPSGSLIWQIGIADNLCNEFADFHKGPERVNIPSVGAMIGADGCSKISKGVRASENPSLDIEYPLIDLPANGALFCFKLIRAPKSGAQMAAFSNGAFAGLIQLWGTDGTNYPYAWRKTYRLYIPKELLKTGQNELRFTAPHPLWSDPSSDNQQWWEWDYLKLEALNAPIAEPWHGKISYLGSTMTMNDHGFDLNDSTLQLTPIVLKWLGIAYSGNTMRANFWYDVGTQQPKKLDYLKLLARYNMTVLADFISGNHFVNDPDGQMPQKMKDALTTFLEDEGKFIQYYELGNEPCMFGSATRRRPCGILESREGTQREQTRLHEDGRARLGLWRREGWSASELGRFRRSSARSGETLRRHQWPFLWLFLHGQSGWKLRL